MTDGWTSSKAPLSSKRFLSLLLAVFTWPCLIVFGSLMQIHYIPLSLMVVTLGFVQVSYIFGQSFTDRYTAGFSAVAQAATASLETGYSLAASAVKALDGVLGDWEEDAVDKDDPDLPPVLLE